MFLLSLKDKDLSERLTLISSASLEEIKSLLLNSLIKRSALSLVIESPMKSLNKSKDFSWSETQL